MAPPTATERLPPRPPTCPHCGHRDPVEVVHDAFDGTASWACATCASDVVPLRPGPRRAITVDEWDEDSGVVYEAKPLGLPRPRAGGGNPGSVTPAKRRRIIQLARKKKSSRAIADLVGVSMASVRRVRAAAGLGAGRYRDGAKDFYRPQLATGGGRCHRCGAPVVFAVEGLKSMRRVTYDVETLDWEGQGRRQVTRKRRLHVCPGPGSRHRAVTAKR